MTMKKNLIGFAGPMSSGKTTAARSLVAKPLAFATPLKQCLSDLFSFTADQLFTLEGKNEIDPRYGISPRTAMQKFGTEFIRETVPDLWLILMKQKLDALPADELIVIDDCRFENEVQFVRGQGGVIIHIEGRRPVASDHRSEAHLKIHATDHQIFNTSDLETFRVNVKNLALSTRRYK